PPLLIAFNLLTAVSVGKRYSDVPGRSYQKFTLTASWITRGSPADEMVPNAAEPSTTFGADNGGVLVRLKISARNSMLRCSPIFVRLRIARSASATPGPRTGLRELWPSLICE